MSLSSDIRAVFLATPPITRTLVTATVVLSVSCHVLHLISIDKLIFWSPYVLTYSRIPQLWRVVTSFVLSGGGLSIIIDPYFLFTYSKQAETGFVRFSPAGEYFTFIIFVCSVILFLAGYILSGYTFISPLIMSLAYMYSIDSPDKRIKFFFIFNIQVRYLPWAMLVVTLLMAGPMAVVFEATGIVAAHAYDFLTRIWPEFGGGRKLITAPLFVQKWFYRPAGTAQTRAYGTAFQARSGPQGGASSSSSASRSTGGSSWTSGFTSGGGTWGSRGPGHRLGGD